MKKIIPIIIVSVVLLAGGIYLLSQQTTHTSEKTEHNQENVTTQSHSSYMLEVIKKADPDQIALDEPTTISYRIKNNNGETIKDFAIAHEKRMHFIIVRKDLTQFQHLHPEFDQDTGEFTVPVTFTVDGPYRFFADFTPSEDNPYKLPVTVHADMAVGDVSNFQPHKIALDTKTDKTIPPNYQVTYAFPDEMVSQNPLTYSLTIEKNNQPITLENYLGALGHSVVLKEGSLTYIHTHAGKQNAADGHAGHEMNTDQQSNAIAFTTTFPEAGNYKVFTEFQHDGNVYVTDYTVAVK